MPTLSQLKHWWGTRWAPSCRDLPLVCGGLPLVLSLLPLFFQEANWLCSWELYFCRFHFLFNYQDLAAWGMVSQESTLCVQVQHVPWGAAWGWGGELHPSPGVAWVLPKAHQPLCARRKELSQPFSWIFPMQMMNYPGKRTWRQPPNLTLFSNHHLILNISFLLSPRPLSIWIWI